MKEIRKSILRFKIKIVVEAIFKSLFLGVLVGSVSTLLFIATCRLIPLKLDLKYDLFVFGGVSLFVFLISFMSVYFPSKRYISARIDGTGLQERVTTSIRLKDDNSDIALLQKEDTLKMVKEQKLNKLSFKLPLKLLIAVPLALGLAITSYYVPYRTPRVDTKEVNKTPEEEYEDKVIIEMIEELEETIKNSNVDESIKEELQEVVDDLKENIKNDTTLEDKIADIEDAKDKIEDIIEKNQSTDKIGEALEGNEATENLGEAIQKGDTAGAQDALDQIKNELNNLEGEEYNQKVDEVTEAIENALNNVNQDSNLKDALDEFVKDLEESKEETDKTQRDEALEEAFEDLKDAIEEEIKKDEELDDLLEEIEDNIENAEEDLANGLEEQEKPDIEGLPGGSGKPGEYETPQGGDENSEKPDVENPEGERPEGENPNGQNPNGQNPEGGDVPIDSPQGATGTGETNHASKEEIYNPGSGERGEYGDFIDNEYAKALESFVNGEITEEEWLSIYEYYSKLYKTIEDDGSSEGGN